MIYNRAQLKEEAKHRLKVDGVPSYKQVTLVFLLLASLLPSLVECLFSTSTLSLSTQLQQAYLNMDMELVNDLMSQFVLSNAGIVAMGCSILMGLFTVVVTVGYQFYTMNLAQNQTAEYDDLSYGLNFVGKVILVTVLEAIYIFLWSMLFVIPGLIAAYRYRLAYYALIDDPSISPGEAIHWSKVLTQGRKMDLFVLDLSFLGWLFLTGLCSSVGQSIGELLFGTTSIVGNMISALLSFVAFLPLGLWVTQYQQLAEVYFYEFARGALIQGQAPGSMDQPPPSHSNGGWQSPNSDNDPWN